MKKKTTLWLSGLGFCLTLCGTYYLFSGSTPSSPVSQAGMIPTIPNQSKDEEHRKLLVGKWKGFFKGNRSLEVREDGTAVMVAEPEGAAALFAKRLEFEIDWTLEDGVVMFETTGGKPIAQVKAILSMYGTSRKHPIIEFSPDKLVLMDEDGVTQYEWTRLTE